MRPAAILSHFRLFRQTSRPAWFLLRLPQSPSCRPDSVMATAACTHPLAEPVGIPSCSRHHEALGSADQGPVHTAGTKPLGSAQAPTRSPSPDSCPGSCGRRLMRRSGSYLSHNPPSRSSLRCSPFPLPLQEALYWAAGPEPHSTQRRRCSQDRTRDGQVGGPRGGGSMWGPMGGPCGGSCGGPMGDPWGVHGGPMGGPCGGLWGAHGGATKTHQLVFFGRIFVKMR